MSTRNYITVNEEKIYEWDETRIEYTCDTCKKVIDQGSPQLHLVTDGWIFSPERENMPRISLDLHDNPECIRNCGLHILIVREAERQYKAAGNLMKMIKSPAS